MNQFVWFRLYWPGHIQPPRAWVVPPGRRQQQVFVGGEAAQVHRLHLPLRCVGTDLLHLGVPPRWLPSPGPALLLGDEVHSGTIIMILTKRMNKATLT
jgi:hypothetical protein